MSGGGTAEDPWQLTTAPGSSSYTMFRDEESDPPCLVCQVGTTTLRYGSFSLEMGGERTLSNLFRGGGAQFSAAKP